MNCDDEKYFAAYDAACSLELFVEAIEGGYPPKPDSSIMKDAKRKLLELKKLEGDEDEDSCFFGRFLRG